MRKIDDAIKELERIKESLPEHLKDPFADNLESYINLVQEWSDKYQLEMVARTMAQERDEKDSN